MTRLDQDGDIDSRVNDLILRGLEAYGQGDVDRAMSFWRHALALDPDSEVAQSYVAYIGRHFEVGGEPRPDAFAGAETEREVPFGVVTTGPTEPFDFEAYARLSANAPAPDAAPKAPARGVDDPGQLDEGWGFNTAELEVDELIAKAPPKPAPRPTYDLESLPDIETGNLADSLEPELADEIAAVTEGLLIAESGAIEMQPERPAYEPLPFESRAQTKPAAAPELDPLVPAPELAAAFAGKDPKATVYGYQPTIKPSSATLQGMPELEAPGELEAPPLELEAQPLELDARPPLESERFAQPGSPAPGFAVDAQRELHVDNTPQTADVPLPPPLSDDLELDIEVSAGDSVGGLGDLTLELGPAPEIEATPPPPELGAPGVGARRPVLSDNLGLDLELGRAGAASGDVQISFHSPDPKTPAQPAAFSDEQAIPLGLDRGDDLELQIEAPGLDSLQIASSSGLEDQLAELEVEMETGAESFEWQAHDAINRPVSADSPPPPPDSPGALAEQIRAAVDRQAVPGEAPGDQLRRRISGFIERAAAANRQDDKSIAVIAADLALSEEPDSATAQKLIHQSQAVLLEVFRSYLGSLDGVPAVGLPMHEIPMQELDHRTAFLLSRIDGTLSFEDILDVSGMPRLEALRYLCRLRLQGILEVR